MKTAILAAIIALVISFSVAAYRFTLLLDDGMALNDARSEVERQRDRGDRALMIIKRDWVGRSLGDVLELSNELHDGGAIVKVYANYVEIDDLIFDVDRDIVVDLRYFD